MNEPEILVTAAAGKTGAAVVARLRSLGAPVRAMVRRADARSAALGQLGAQVVVGDLFDPVSLRAALRGIRRAYYVPPFLPYATQAAAAFAVAARDARLEGVVQLSQWLSHPTHRSVLTRETWLVDRTLASIPGVAHVIVNPGMFADNFLRVADFASLLHVYPVLTGESASAPVSNEDVAKAVAALLLDLPEHDGRRYRPTGPALLTGREIARVLSGVLGQRVVPVDLPFWMFSKAARMTGAHVHEVFNYRDYLEDHRRGAFSIGGGVTDDVLRLSGEPAEPFEVTARRYLDLPFARRTAANRIRALARFAVLPLWPGHDLRAYARRMGFPEPGATTLCADDDAWMAERGDVRMAPQATGPAASFAMPATSAAATPDAPIPANRGGAHA